VSPDNANIPMTAASSMHHDRVIAPQSGAQQAAILGGNIIIVGYPEVDLHDHEFG